MDTLLVAASGHPQYDAIIVARRQIVTAQRLTIAAMVAAASFAIFQVNVPFAGGDLADYNAYSERVRQCGKLVM